MPPKKTGSHSDGSQNASQGYSLADVMSKLTALGSDLTTVKESQGEVMTSIDFLSGKFDEITKQLAEMKALNDALKQENDTLKSQVTKLQRDVQHLEQYNRGQNLEIVGIPEKPQEDTGSVVMTVLKKIDSGVCDGDVDIVHRAMLIAHRPSGDRPLIGRFGRFGR